MYLEHIPRDILAELEKFAPPKTYKQYVKAMGRAYNKKGHILAHTKTITRKISDWSFQISEEYNRVKHGITLVFCMFGGTFEETYQLWKRGKLIHEIIHREEEVCEKNAYVYRHGKLRQIYGINKDNTTYTRWFNNGAETKRVIHGNNSMKKIRYIGCRYYKRVYKDGNLTKTVKRNYKGKLIIQRYDNGKPCGQKQIK